MGNPSLWASWETTLGAQTLLQDRGPRRLRPAPSTQPAPATPGPPDPGHRMGHCQGPWASPERRHGWEHSNGKEVGLPGAAAAVESVEIQEGEVPGAEEVTCGHSEGEEVAARPRPGPSHARPGPPPTPRARTGPFSQQQSWSDRKEALEGSAWAGPLLAPCTSPFSPGPGAQRS